MSKPSSRVVFVGNIPYGLSEEQITDIFSSAGKVLNFRLVYDRETGRPKGFGFAEYPDTDSAASAVRNLNDYETMGRKLRVDFSNEGGSDDNDTHAPVRDGTGPTQGSNGYGQPLPAVPQNSSLPPLPAGKELPANVTATDAISRTLNTLPPSQLLDILTQMKALATNDPGRAAELFQQAPQLSYAVFQALLLMGLVSPEAIQAVIDPGAGVPPPASQPNPAAYAAGVSSTPPVAAQPYAVPPPAAHYGAPAPAAPVPAAADPDTDALVQQVLSLPLETINMLPEAERAQILALRAQYAGQHRR